MRVSYLQKNRSRSNYARAAAVILGVFVFVALVFSIADGFFISAASPLWKADNKISRGLGNFIGFFSSKKSLIEENTSLKEEVASLELKIASLSSGRVQEGALLELIGRSEPGAEVASILTRPPRTPYDVLVIDAGEDIVSVGSEIGLAEGIGLGIVSEVFSKNSRVRLFSSPGAEIEAVLERGNVPVTLKGAGSGNFTAIVPRDAEIEAGDAILSAGIPARLIAVVEGVKSESTDSFKEAYARSPVNIFSVRYVVISP